jgi:putative glutathione S-transferase
MGMVVDGKWRLEGRKPDKQGRFVRAETRFRNRITADGGSGFPAEAGRYHLYVSWACPWAHRTLILRKLKHLEAAVTLSVVDPFMGEMGWEFTSAPGAIPDPVYGKRYLHEIYIQGQPGYTGRASVPVLWDKQQECIVNNESREIARMFDTAFGAVNGSGASEGASAPADYCPPELEDEVERTIDAIYQPINNGVYRSGFARTQQAYEEAVTELFDALDQWEHVLETQRYLCGDLITEADWCMFTTLVRFDPVYHFHFKCNKKRLRDFPNLWNYTRELYQVPGVAETCNFDHIKRHYFQSHETLNPTRIVPMGPDGLDFAEPHDRDRSYPS